MQSVAFEACVRVDLNAFNLTVNCCALVSRHGDAVIATQGCGKRQSLPVEGSRLG